MKKIICITLLLLCITGCKDKIEQLDKMSEAIINYHRDYNYVVKDLSDENEKILLDFKEKQKQENKVINLTKLELFTEDTKNYEPDSEGVYKENGDYYIKYNDINWIKVNDEDYIANINVDGYLLCIPKYKFPILYDETNNVNYKYRFMQKEEKDNTIKYHYRSYGDGSMLTIEYQMDNNRVKDIDLIYNDYYLLEEEKEPERKKSNFTYIAFMVVIAGILGFIIIKSLKAYSLSRKI